MLAIVRKGSLQPFLSRLLFRKPLQKRYTHHSSFTYRTHTCGELRNEHVGENVTLCGWIKKPRKLGAVGTAFIPLTDATGVTQLVFSSEDVLDSMKPESVVKAIGRVQQRPVGNVNKDLPTGNIEVVLSSLEVMNEAEDIPFSMAAKAPPATEELRLKERHLDLRRAPLQHNLRLRSQVAMTMREFLIHQHGFVEVETPTLFRKTSEGAREFVVPTRSPGKFYTLPQSPQQFKQLLMVGGFDRYFQFARCYRDEDLRADRQPEFTQVDLEMSFVTADHVMSLTEQLVVNALGKTVPHMKIPDPPFPRMPYMVAMEKYGSDKPDTRYNMELQCLDHIWEQTRKDDETQVHLQGFKIEQWEDSWKSLDIRKLQYDIDMIAYESNVIFLTDEIANANPDAKFEMVLDDQTLQLIRESMQHTPGDLCVVGVCQQQPSKRLEMLTILGSLRVLLASVMAKTGHLKLDHEQLSFHWVTDFPLFTMTTEDSELGTATVTVESTHHPFTAPLPEQEHLLLDKNNLTEVKGQHYDLVVNGVELGGGSIRIHNADVQENVLQNILKVPTEEFHHLLKALKSGCPPHGGIALGFDRLMSVLCQAASLRDVIAFPKSFLGKDLLTGSPSEIHNSDLSGYHISIVRPKYSNDRD